MFGVLPKQVGEILRELCRCFKLELVVGHVMPDHAHMCLGIPSKYSVANTMGETKRKIRNTIAPKYGPTKKFCRYEFLGKRILY